MGYLKVSRELLNSSFWRSLAPAEKGILIDLMAMAAYKPRTFNLHGYKIQLNRFELCVSLNSFSESVNMGRRKVVSLLDRFAKNSLLSISTITASQSDSEYCNEQGNKVCNEVKGYMGRKKFTLITFLPSAFGHENEDEDYPTESDTKATSSEMSFATENKEITKQNINTQNTREKVSSFPDGRQKTWYPVDAIAKVEIPKGDELLKSWCVYSGKNEEKVKAFLEKYCEAQLLIDIKEMTLDIFDHRFRIAMKKEFNIRDTKPAESEEFIRYLN